MQPPSAPQPSTNHTFPSLPSFPSFPSPPRQASTKWPVDAKSKPRSRACRTPARSEEHTSELQSLMRISYAVFCLKKTNNTQKQRKTTESSNNHEIRHKIKK